MTRDQLRELMYLATPGPWKTTDRPGEIILSDVSAAYVFNTDDPSAKLHDAACIAAFGNLGPLLLELWEAAKETTDKTYPTPGLYAALAALEEA